MSPVGYFHEDQQCAACNSIRDISPIAIDKKRVPCRYYQTGNCRRGPNCPFAHISVAAQTESRMIPRLAYLAGEHMYAYYPVRQSPVYHPLDACTHPVFVWPSYVPASSSFDPHYGLVCQTEHLSDHPDDKSDPSSTESSSTATSLDWQLRTALDTPWSEGIESGVVASPLHDVGTSLSPGYAGYSHPVFPGVKTEGKDRTATGSLDHGETVALSSPFVLPWQDGSGKKPLAYKTKPCKFYQANGKCTSGEKCTFIHDSETKPNVKKPPSKLALPKDAKLPPKPLDKYEDSRARDFYPITWRVIGGGVMMGGQRQICPAFAAGQCKYGSDCKLAHETELESDEIGYIEPRHDSPQEASPPQLNGVSQKRVRPQRKAAKVPPPGITQPMVRPPATPRPQRPNVSVLHGMREKGAQVTALSAPPSPVHRRSQSMSMVATSPPPLDTSHSSYAAEL